jgi:hypothetical protein
MENMIRRLGAMDVQQIRRGLQEFEEAARSGENLEALREEIVAFMLEQQCLIASLQNENRRDAEGSISYDVDEWGTIRARRNGMGG